MPNLDGLEASLRIRALECGRSPLPGSAPSAQGVPEVSDSGNLPKRRRRQSAPTSATAPGNLFCHKSVHSTAYCNKRVRFSKTPAYDCGDSSTSAADEATVESNAVGAGQMGVGNYQPLVILAVTCSSYEELWDRPVLKQSARTGIFHSLSRFQCTAANALPTFVGIRAQNLYIQWM